MARINVEDCWWSDPRRTKLMLKIGLVADAAAINMWRAAQEFWKNGRRKIPKHVFFSLEFAEDLLGSSLAEIDGDEVYVRGSSQYLDWIYEEKERAKEKGSKGGKKSAQRPRDKMGRLLKKETEKEEKVQAESKQSPSKSKLSVSVSGSDSVSDSGSETKFPTETTKKASRFISLYCQRFKSRHGTNPEISGKDSGIAKRVSKNLSDEKMELYLDAFFQIPDSLVIKRKHPIADFEFKLNEIVVFANSGKFTTYRESREMDSMAQNMILLEEVRRGEV